MVRTKSKREREREATSKIPVSHSRSYLLPYKRPFFFLQLQRDFFKSRHLKFPIYAEKNPYVHRQSGSNVLKDIEGMVIEACATWTSNFPQEYMCQI